MEINKHYCVNPKKNKVASWSAVFIFVVASFSAEAFMTSDIEKNKKEGKLNKTKVEYYQNDNITNQVPYFDNRFRLDANLDEITLIFYRKSGSKPIILIRPDGSKIRVNEFDHKKVQWFDDRTFDMIKIKNPMPGPWQAVGDILPHSQILVVSDIKIAVEPLPEIAFSGETLKVVGRLFNGDEAIDSPHFKNVVKLDVNFYSTNNSAYENFGADAIKVTSFRDDGYGLDEYANDNIFTGEFILDFAPGEWQPVYLVKLPMVTRELRQSTILLQKTPVAVSVVKSQVTDKPHQILLTIDPSYVDPNSLIFQGEFTFPDRQVEPFSIMESHGETRSTTMANTEPGLYRINVSAFGKTITGREFRLVLPEYTFNVEATNQLIASASVEANSGRADTITVDLLAKTAQEKELALLNQQQAQNKQDQETILLIVAGNGVIILIAVVLFFSLRRKKAKTK
ncbi:TIGR03503 family protein [Colwellia sp. TT2012]|uniref:TIGR03503 family protein n=1 Tax=Colwellia sp. TT2012 TaxID=1720342 RepID=UPI00070D08F7|nr:TIGR03503 family protein [Colwellia sp. TT2012]